MKRRHLPIFLFLCLSLNLVPVSGNARDFGVQGTLFPIGETDLLAHIQERVRLLTTGPAGEEGRRAVLDRIRNSLERPTPLPLKTTVHPRVYFHDPSITVPYDLRDHRGRPFHRAGMRVNPLEHRPLTKPLVFFKGDSSQQVAWVQAHYPTAKLILVSGAPFELMDQMNMRLYFDQGGFLTQKFHITQVPAVVEQDGHRLKISELKPEVL